MSEENNYCNYSDLPSPSAYMDDNSKVTRFEVIDENGRVYTKYNCEIELSYQDDGKTLKVFIKPLN